MFKSFFGEFERDPFFRGNPISDMESMMHDPFEGFFGHRKSDHLALGGPAGKKSTVAHNRRRGQFDGFGMGSIFENMNSMFEEFSSMREDPNVHSFTSSNVYSYQHDSSGGQPKVYQAHSSTRAAPGGLKEVRKAVRNSESGLQKMEIGHHLGERAHIVTRSRNLRTCDEDEHKELHGIHEGEEENFDREWKSVARRSVGGREKSTQRALHVSRQ